MIVKNYLCNMKVFDENRKYVEAQNETGNPADFAVYTVVGQSNSATKAVV